MLHKSPGIGPSYVGIDRDQIFGEVGVVLAGASAIDVGRLVQGRGDAPDQPAHQLALGGRRSTMRPAANAPTTRGQRISRVYACTRTSTNSAPKANWMRSFILAPPASTAWPWYTFLKPSGGTPCGLFSA